MKNTPVPGLQKWTSAPAFKPNGSPTALCVYHLRLQDHREALLRPVFTPRGRFTGYEAFIVPILGAGWTRVGQYVRPNEAVPAVRRALSRGTPLTRPRSARKLVLVPSLVEG